LTDKMANNPRAKDNLRPPWPKGKSANPGGQGKGPSLTSLLKKYKNTKKRIQIEGKRTDSTYEEIMILRIWEKVVKGDLEAIKFIFDRIEGKAIARHELEGKLEALGNIKVYLDGKDPE